MQAPSQTQATPVVSPAVGPGGESLMICLNFSQRSPQVFNDRPLLWRLGLGVGDKDLGFGLEGPGALRKAPIWSEGSRLPLNAKKRVQSHVYWSRSP